MVRYLIKQGSNIYDKNNYAIKLASENDYPEIVRLLAEKEPMFMQLLIQQYK